MSAYRSGHGSPRRASPASRSDLLPVRGDHHTAAEVVVDETRELNVVERRRAQPDQDEGVHPGTGRQLADIGITRSDIDAVVSGRLVRRGGYEARS